MTCSWCTDYGRGGIEVKSEADFHKTRERTIKLIIVEVKIEHI